MRNLILSFLISAAFIGCAHTSLKTGDVSSTVEKIPLEDFFRNSEVDNYQISPDGKQVSFLRAYKNRMNIHVYPVGRPEEVKRLTSVTDRDIREYFWKGNGTIVYLKDRGGDENYHIYTVDLKNGRNRDLTPYSGVRAEIVDELEEASSTDILARLNRRDKRIFDVYRINVVTGESKLVLQNPGSWVSFLADHNGVICVAIATDGVEHVYFYRESGDTDFKKVFSTDFKTNIVPQLFTTDNRYVYTTSDRGRDLQALVKIDFSTGKELETVYSHPKVDIEGVYYSKKEKKLVAAMFTTWRDERHFFNKRFENIFESMEDKMPNMALHIVSSNDDEDNFVVLAYSDVDRGSYYLYSSKDNSLSLLGIKTPWLKDESLAKMSPVKYKSRDGLTINGYLTLPPGREARNLPVVVNPHGGPWSRDVWGFDPEVQFLANRGYAVLQLNFRGSTGYGRKFWEASFKEWGKSMQDDITDGIKWLVKKKIADPKRICIYGGSYGGYATLAGLAFTPELYACGIDYVGISSLFTLFNSMPPYWEPYRKMMYEMIGDPEKDKEMLTKISPLFSADKIKVPLLVAQGANDPRVNKQESDQIVTALKKRDVPVKYIVKNNEGHGFKNEENRMDFYRAMESFLAEYLDQALYK